ncbi:MAG: hypothetical protein V4736_02060 [Bdellovibrionota bacterium]
MEPRLKSSKKWTAFPGDFVQQIQALLAQNFKKKSKEGSFKVEGRIYPEEIILRMGYVETGRLTQINFETSVDYNPQQQDTMEKIYLCVDAGAQMMAEYFEAEGKSDEEQMDYPLAWKLIEYDKKKIFLQFTTVNSDLEAEANRLLGIEEGKLVEGELEDDEDDDEGEETGKDFIVREATPEDEEDDDEDPGLH